MEPTQRAGTSNIFFRLLFLPAVLLLPMTGGCALLGYGAALVAPEEKEPAPPRYIGLAGQTTAIMVYADFDLQATFPDIQLHTAQALQAKLIEGRDKFKDKELAGMNLKDSGLVRQFQLDHPDVNQQPIEEVAARMRPKEELNRLIYIEISEFETHPPDAIALFRGTANVALKVVEVSGPPDARKAKVVFKEDDLRVMFPPKSKDGVAMGDGVSDRTIYTGTVALLADELSKRFYMPPEK